MSQTVTIEIPVTVKDNTSAGVSSVTKKLTAFEKSMQRMQKQMDRLEKIHTIGVETNDHASDRIGAIEAEVEKIDSLNAEIEMGVSDAATDAISDVQGKVDTLDGAAAMVDADANDMASSVMDNVQDKVSETDGAAAMVDADANDMASSVMDSVQDKVSETDGASATVEIEANDTASSVIDSVRDKLSAWAGSSGSGELGVNDSASSVIDEVQSKASEWGGSVWTGTLKVAGSGLALLGVSAGFSDTVNTYKDFEATMSQVEAISGASGAALEDLTAKAKAMGATTKFTATEAAEAMNYMAMAGWESSDMLSGIEGIMNLAAASGEDLATTSDIVTDALTAFGLSAADSDHFADVLAVAASSSNTTVAGMGDTFKYAGAMAGTLGYSIDDVALATGLMANSGIKGSMAGTALNTMFTRLATNTSGAADELEALGINFYDAEGNANALSDVLGQLRDATADWNDEEKTALANTVAGTEAQKGLMAILNASEEDYNDLAKAIANADGASASMAQTMLDNLEGSITLMQSAIDGVKTEVGARLAPYIASVAEMITAAAPGAQEVLLGIMDTVDAVASHTQSMVTQMTSSDAWKDADLSGKIDIAWDTLIADPFREWVSTDGVDMLSSGLSTLFSEAGKILPGGEDAGIASWISAAILGKGAATIAGGASSLAKTLQPIGTAIKGVASAASAAGSVGEFIGSLGSMVPMGATVGIAAAAIVGSIALISSAIDDYNDKQLNSSLEEHFGSIELSAAEAAEAAEQILESDYMVNVRLYLGQVENAEALHEQAEAALEANEYLNYKASILNVELSADEQTEYKDNISTFIESKISEIEAYSYSAYVGVSTFLTGEDGEDLAAAISNYALEDELNMEALSSQLTEAVDSALSDGILDVDEVKHIQELQAKMNAITSQWAQQANQAELSWINSQYGSMSAEQLSSGGFVELVSALQEQRATNNAEVHEASTSLFETLYAMNDAGRLGPENGLKTVGEYENLINQAIRNTQANELANTVLALENNTLDRTYGDKIGENLASSQAKTSSQMSEMDSYLQMYDPNNSSSKKQTAYDLATLLSDGESMWNSGNGIGAFGAIKDADQNALNTLYESMKPDVTEMGNLIDAYTEAGQAVPQSVMDAYNEAIETGAAAGDSDAAWQAYANELLESGSEELKSALTDESNPMYEELRSQLPEELSKALDRASAETTSDPIELDDLTAELNGGEIEGMDEWLADMQQQLGDAGEIEADAEGNVHVTVNKGDCLSEIGEAMGVDWHEIAEYNGLEDPYTIYPGMTLEIPPELVETDASGVEEGAEQLEQDAQQTAEEATSEPVEVEKEVDTTYVPGEEDKSALEEERELEESEPAEQEVPTVVTFNVSSIDDSELSSAVSDKLAEGDPVPVIIPAEVTVEVASVDSTALSDGITGNFSGEDVAALPVNVPADIAVQQQSFDASEAVASAQNDLTAAFADTLPADGYTDVTITKTGDNIAAVYSQVGSELASAFAAGYSVSANAVITVNYSLANPTASISFSGGGTGSATVSASLHAAGGAVGQNGAELSWVGEEGLEYIIPTVPGRRSRGISLWEEAGMALGVLDADGNIAAHANGGIVGSGGQEISAHNSIIPLAGDREQEVWSVTGEKLSGNMGVNEGRSEISAGNTQETGGGNTFQVSVDCNPLIQIDGDGMDEDKVVEVMKSRIREFADDLGDEIAEKLMKIFQNMPVTAEA